MDSNVITDEGRVESIEKWMGGSEFAPKLMYSASHRDGWDGNFHRLRDGKGAFQYVRKGGQ